MLDLEIMGEREKNRGLTVGRRGKRAKPKPANEFEEVQPSKVFFFKKMSILIKNFFRRSSPKTKTMMRTPMDAQFRINCLLPMEELRMAPMEELSFR